MSRQPTRHPFAPGAVEHYPRRAPSAARTFALLALLFALAVAVLGGWL